jgi:hypothetical protein
VSDLSQINLLPAELKTAILEGLDIGFQDEPLQLIIKQ